MLDVPTDTRTSIIHSFYKFKYWISVRTLRKCFWQEEQIICRNCLLLNRVSTALHRSHHEPHATPELRKVTISGRVPSVQPMAVSDRKSVYNASAQLRLLMLSSKKISDHTFRPN